MPPLDSRKVIYNSSTEKEFKTPRLEDSLRQSYDYFWNSGEGHIFFNKDETSSIHTRAFIEARNKSLMVILPGRGESSLKYAELALEMKGQGLDIVIIDHRGQGLSDRSNNGVGLIHIDRFDHYVDDLNIVYEQFTKEKEYKSKIILAHSMGAAIALRHIQKESKQCWDGLILSSPMLKIKSQKVPLLIASWILSFYTLIGRGLSAVWDKHIQDDKREFQNNNVTHCQYRFEWARQLESLHPQTLSNAPSVQWLKEAISTGKRVMKDKRLFKKPILLIQADSDTVVCNEAQNKFAHEVENCRIIRLKDCRHEVLQENNSVRNRALVQINQFLKAMT